MSKFEKWSLTWSLIIVVFFFVRSPLYQILNKESHQKEYLKKNNTHKIINKSGTYFINEDHQFPYKGDTILMTSYFELVVNSVGKIESHKIVCVCDCEEYKNK